MKKVFLSVLIVFGVMVLVLIFSKNSIQIYSRGELILPEFMRAKEAKILFVGDMFFDRYIRQVSDAKGGDFVFSCIGDFLKDFDLVVGNLEGPITENPSISMGTKIESPENYTFTFPPATAKLLAKNNIKIVNLGNNHTENFGQEGVDSTKKYLTEARVNYFRNYTIYRIKLNGINMSFISYNEFGGDDIQKISEEIKREKENGQMVFVYAHWGDEYSNVSARIKEIVALFSKNGADFIAGSHPHIILPSEKIPSTSSGQRDTVVYYSLGNFIFDQYWNKEVSTGLVLELNIKGNETKIIEHRVSLLPDGRTCLTN